VEAHQEHVVHACDAGGVPTRNVGIEVTQGIEEPAHVGDARDVPVGDGAVIIFGGGHVGVVLTDRRLQFGLGRKDAEQAAVVVSGWPGGVGGQEYRQPLRRARDGMVGLRQFARHTGLRRVRGEGAEGGDADEDERAEARSVLLRLRLRRGIYKAHNAEPRTGCSGTGRAVLERAARTGYPGQRWLSNRASRHPMISSGKEPGANTGIMHAMQVTVYVHVWACHVVGYGRVGFIGFRVQSLFELKLGCGRGPQPTNGWLG